MDLVVREDVDAVVICTNNNTHGQMAIVALEVGKPVVTEDLLVCNSDESARIVDRSISRNQYYV